MTMLTTLSRITERNPSSGESLINGQWFKVIEDCENDYHKGHLPIIPAGAHIAADFAGGFGMYGVAEVDGVLYKVRVPLEELHKINFGVLDARNI